MVDDFFLARLTEFGLDKLMVQFVADEIMSQAKSDGYKAAELNKMKKCNPRTDVYTFWILLLEMLMGIYFCWLKSRFWRRQTMEVFDLEALKGIRSPMEDGLVHALKLAMGCCAPAPSVRPTMEENRPRNRSPLYCPNETRSGVETQS